MQTDSADSSGADRRTLYGKQPGGGDERLGMTGRYRWNLGISKIIATSLQCSCGEGFFCIHSTECTSCLRVHYAERVFRQCRGVFIGRIFFRLNNVRYRTSCPSVISSHGIPDTRLSRDRTSNRSYCHAYLLAKACSMEQARRVNIRQIRQGACCRQLNN